MGYDYKQCCADGKNLSAAYDFVQMFSIGQSVMQKELYCIKLGEGNKKLFVNGAHHGLEYLTSAFLMKFLNDYAKHITENTLFYGYNAAVLKETVQLYAVPMVNPDGVDIAIHGIDITNPYHRELISSVGIHSFHKVWQANAHGVDINHNYDALWQPVSEKPSPSRYSGPYSESEPETRAIINFVRDINCDMLVAFHSQGGEIYYDFDGKVSRRSQEMAEKLSGVSGYTMAVPEGSAAFGGCKDWFINEFSKAGFTVEIGHGSNPLPIEMLDDIYEENAKLLLCAMTEL